MLGQTQFVGLKFDGVFFLVDLGLCRMILIELVTLLLAEQVQSSRFLEGYKWVQN